MSDRLYVMYDGRAAFDLDDALVLYTTDTLDEAIEQRQYYADAVIYSYATGGEYLTDARLEVTADGRVLHPPVTA